jgi:hypothetical protein
MSFRVLLYCCTDIAQMSARPTLLDSAFQTLLGHADQL